MSPRRLTLLAVVVVVFGHAPVRGQSRSEINPRLLRRFSPLRVRFDDAGQRAPEALVRLGRALFYDSRLSRAGDTKCASCHPLDRFGTDGKTTSVGFGGKLGRRNSPSVFNAAAQFGQFWDGRADTIEGQAGMPFLSADEMAMSSKANVEHRLKAIAGYQPLFRAAFPDDASPITFDHVARAIGSFERGLSTPSRWDRYLRGNLEALTQAEKEGFKVFSNSGCLVCHTGELLGGSTFQRVGIVVAWPNQRDAGRAELTHAVGDKMVFKVPSLRNVVRTAPYFHDGSAPDLPTAIRMMGHHQLGIDLSSTEVHMIMTWLDSLTGSVDVAYTARPPLPQ